MASLTLKKALILCPFKIEYVRKKSILTCLSHGTDRFSVYTSAKLDTGWSVVATGNLPDVSGVTCEHSPAMAFGINSRGRYVKIRMESFHGQGAALQFVNVVLDGHSTFKQNAETFYILLLN